jgi:UPF0755 protein
MKRIFVGAVLFCFVSVLVIYCLLFLGNVSNEYQLKLRTSTPISSVMNELLQNEVISSPYKLDLVQTFYPITTVSSGRYLFRKGMSTKEILSKLKHGQQDPISFTLSTATFIEDVASKAGNKMSFDSLSLMDYLRSDSAQTKYEINQENQLCLFLPNTHEIYWTTSVEDFVDKFYKDYTVFWNSERKSKAQSLGMSPNQVYILASMVQKEYSKRNERSKIAGVLLNRLKKSMPLQVDATCKYATKDFAAKRVLSYHTTFTSPYNTYQNQGLTPGPICMPELETIDAVLNAESHQYLYYCADPSLNGFHVFSTTYKEHNSVASKYHQRMNELKMK